jgi:hypothetical protein
VKAKTKKMNKSALRVSVFFFYNFLSFYYFSIFYFNYLFCFLASEKPFVATNEWQKIEPGQAIPKGLHVRINLQTGEREARLLQPDEQQSANEENKDSIYSHEYLKKALKNIKAETLVSESSSGSEVCCFLLLFF